MGFDEYLDQVKAQIRSRDAGGFAEEEMRDHMEDQAEAYEREGMTREEAISETIRQMGDPVEAGIALDRVHRPAMDMKMILLAGVISVLGLALQYQITDGQSFARQCVFTGMGVALMAFFCWLDYSILGKWGIALWTLFTMGLWIVTAFGPTLNGGYGYLRPVLYLYAPLFAGILYHYRGGGSIALGKVFLFFLFSVFMGIRAVTLPVCLDLAFIAWVLTYLAIRRGWFMVRKKQALTILWGLAVLLPVLAGIWGFFLGGFAPYQIARIQAVVTPWVFPEEMGYMVGNIRDILSQSRLIGFGVETAGRVPGPHTDYVLLWIMAYYGILAGLGILALLGGMVLRIFRNSSRQKNQLGFLTGIGCGLVFMVEIFHYVMVNLGLSQMGLGGLPLLSYGRYQMLASYLLLGIALSVYRYKDIPKDGNIKVLS